MNTSTRPLVFAGGGEMGERIRSFDWSATPVGPIAQWPASLRTAVAILLECKLPMYIGWGPAFTQFYNDAYRPILGDKHPAALGESVRVTWSEIWPTIGPMWHEVLGGQSIGYDDFKLTINRYGYPEDCYFNFSYSPVPDDEGRAAGVLVTFAETTQRLRSERRLKLLDDIAQTTRGLDDAGRVMHETARLLGTYLGVSRCAYAHVHEDQDTFDLVGDFNVGVRSIVGRYRFSDFGVAVLRLMRAGQPYVNEDVDRDPQTAGTDLAAYRQTEIQAVICMPLLKNGVFVAAMAVHQSVPRHWTAEDVALVQTVVDRCWETLERIRTAAAQKEEARLLEVLNRTGADLASELELDVLLQHVTDAATELTGAKFGAFFYNGVDAQGDALLLYALSGAPRSAFESLGHPRPTGVFGPTFRGESPVRMDDVLADPRYGQFAPHHGMPAHHLPVRSYLAVSVVSRSGQVIGGLFFGHPETGVFTERSERLAVGIAGQAAIAVDNARLFAQAQQAAAERTALLESERAARSEAERASKTKDEFLATLSHELRTPLSAIMGWVQILKRKFAATSPEIAKGVEVIERSTRIQVQLIEDLLDMSRITSGKMRLDMQPVAAIGFVQAAVDVIQPAADAGGVALVAGLETTDPVLGDSVRLQQVIWNLLANAVKFTPRGGIVTVSLRAVGGHAEIRVTDTGVGIKPEFLPSIFDRFRQADGSITRRFGGLGLGLSIVRNLVELHGGTIAAQSAGEGHGSTFVVRIPVLSASQSPTMLRPAGPGNWTTGGPDLSGITVLVVDDERDAREVVARILHESGAEVVTAEDAVSGLRVLQETRPHVLVSDIGMPNVDGYELLQRVRLLGVAGGAVPAIALTAFARTEDRERSLQAGFSMHLTKPVDPFELAAGIARLAPQRNQLQRP